MIMFCCLKFSENILCRREIPGVTVIPRPIEPLDHWNSSFYKVSMTMHADKSRLTDVNLSSTSYKEAMSFLEEYNEYTINAWKLRDSQPDLVPIYRLYCVCDSRFQVHFDLPLSEFIELIRIRIEWKEGRPWTKPLFLYFKNTDPPAGTSMYVINKENKDDDEFLNITYSGEEKGAWTELNNEEFARKVKI
ncbi:hypothetical protein ACFX2B_029468 [Malus domestica]